MKRGVKQLQETYEPLSNKVKQAPLITKPLGTLLAEVFSGDFTDFRAYLRQQAVTSLELTGLVRNQNLALLGQALQGTQVTTINLSGNHIGDAGHGISVKRLKTPR